MSTLVVFMLVSYADAYANTGQHNQTNTMEQYTMTKQNPIAQSVYENPYSFPGAYPMFAMTDDGGVLCPTCCGENATEIAESVAKNGWHVIASGINWEDNDLICDHCGNHIECAYPDDENN